MVATAPLPDTIGIADGVSLSAGDGALELLPIAAVMGGVTDGKVVFDLPNRAFRQLGLSLSDDISPFTVALGARVATFLDGVGEREEFSWRTGDAVEQRHFRVTLARAACPAGPRCLVSLVDQTNEMRTELNLRREMTTDSLTGLPNRSGFTDRLEAVLAAGSRKFAILTIDLDRFSRVNACLGSMVGDELLITTARRIKAALRAGDVLARTGGDEFAVLIAIDEADDEAEHVARRIRAALATPFRLSDYETRVSCAIGMAFGSDHFGDAEDVIRHAQFAMKRSKKSGHAEVYQTQAFDQAREEFAMETSLRRAIDAGQLTLHYQPICDLATGRIVAFESLARWIGDDGRATPPDAFIRVAEESGLIIPLGRWAIDTAVQTLASWDARAGGSCGVKMAVNLSAIQLQRDTIAPVVEAALATHGIAGERLKLELTESALIAEPDRTARVLHALKALGTTIAMDDFGTGYSNLAYLQRLPIDVLKIDRSFVTGMLADRDKIAIVRAILGLAGALNMDTVAEGIESPEVGQTLAALGCVMGQGYAYARPLEADAAYALLIERNA